MPSIPYRNRLRNGWKLSAHYSADFWVILPQQNSILYCIIPWNNRFSSTCIHTHSYFHHGQYVKNEQNTRAVFLSGFIDLRKSFMNVILSLCSITNKPCKSERKKKLKEVVPRVSHHKFKTFLLCLLDRHTYNGLIFLFFLRIWPKSSF